MSIPIIPSFPQNFEDLLSHNGQNLRKGALHSQLLALESQVKVMQSLATEHTLGIENCGEFERLCNHARDLVKSAEIIVDRSSKVRKEITVNSLRALRETAIRLIHHADVLDKAGLERAKMRLDECLSEHADVPLKAVEGIVPNDAERMAVKAGYSCYLAESEQFNTFALQIRALCHLTLEYAYVAAAESPSFKSTDGK